MNGISVQEQVEKIESYLWKRYRKQNLTQQEIAFEILYPKSYVGVRMSTGDIVSTHIFDIAVFIVTKL